MTRTHIESDNAFGDLTVSSFLNTEGFGWDLEALRGVFWDCDLEDNRTSYAFQLWACGRIGEGGILQKMVTIHSQQLITQLGG